MKLNCIIVDDEPLARQVLEGYIKDHPTLHLKNSCKDALQAYQALQKNKIDLIFLDINMPKLTGISFLKSLAQKPKVIMTTAYSEYAVEGFELAVSDYLLKPISFERFMKAVGRVAKEMNGEQRRSQIPSSSSAQTTSRYLFIRVENKIIKVDLEEIYYLEAYGNYVKFFLANKMYLTKKTMNDFAKTLPAEQFVRIHRSYLIAFEKMDCIEGNHVCMLNKKIPISRPYKQALMERLALNG